MMQNGAMTTSRLGDAMTRLERFLALMLFAVCAMNIAGYLHRQAQDKGCFVYPPPSNMDYTLLDYRTEAP